MHYKYQWNCFFDDIDRVEIYYGNIERPVLKDAGFSVYK